MTFPLVMPHPVIQAASGFVENPVTFDGSNDYLKLSSDLTGVADGRTAYIFISHDFANTASANEYLLHGFANFGAILIARNSAGKISVTIRDTTGSPRVNMASTDAVGAEKTNIFVSVDADGTSYLYLWTPTLGAWTLEATDPSGGGGDLDWTPGTFTIGAQDNGSNKTAGNMSRVAMHFNPTALPDFSLTAVQEKFASGSTGAVIDPAVPIADYGTPQLDFYGDADTVWNAGANQGSSGDTFTMTGAVVNA